MKKINNVSVKFDDNEYKTIQALADEKNTTLSNYIRSAIAHYGNVKEANKNFIKQQLFNQKILSYIEKVDSKQKQYFRNLLETLITISPKHKDIILEIWNNKDKY